MSASDQNCEIESLVDELCEKLKEVNSDPISDSASATAALKEPHKHKITRQELAEKYYAAFPPLCPKSPSKLISLLPKWRPAPSPSRKKSVRKPNNRQAAFENRLNGEMIKSRIPYKPRFNYLSRNKNGICSRSTERMDNVANWDVCVGKPKKGGGQKLKNITNIQDTLDQCVEANREIWNNDDDEMKMYDDLPVDIQELLDSPTPQDDNVEMMNMANMRDDGKRNYIPYGTNITSSIWSNDRDFAFDNKFNASVEGADSESMLDFKFSSISIDGSKPEADWPPITPLTENLTNTLFENNRERSLFLEGFHSLPDEWKTVDEECFENEQLLKQLTVSLMKLNHNKEKSCFAEIIPRSKPASQVFNPFGRSSDMFGFNSRQAVGFEREKEDLLTSERSHFKPINEKLENRNQSKYADGATFMISDSLDKVDYKRSESGSMLLETEFGHSKKYWEYKLEDSSPSPQVEFVLKFSICQNDKACQTEELSEMDFGADSGNWATLKLEKTVENMEEFRCSCPAFKMDNSSGSCLVHPARAESVLGEVLWKYEAIMCEKCNNDNMWNADWAKRGQLNSEWDNQNLRNIWSGGEVCATCLNGNNGSIRPPPSLQLREDISQDGEQLLSDLSSLQKTYMEELPLAELNFGAVDLGSLDLMPKERKRRHSFIAAHVNEAALDIRGTWSFASRLEENCLIQMSTLPTLRSVTL